MSHRVLFVTTSHFDLGTTGRRTGFWFEELAAPWFVLREGGVRTDIASIAGGMPPADPTSLTEQGGETAVVDRFQADSGAMELLRNSLKIDEVDSSAYDGVFLVGGHGTMWDFPASAPLKTLIERLNERGGVLAAVCHGVAGLVEAQDGAGRALVAGRKVCAFTDGEEEVIGLTQAVPFLLEARLRERGAHFQHGVPFQSNAVRDGNLVTGQNPQSSELVGSMLLKALTT